MVKIKHTSGTWKYDPNERGDLQIIDEKGHLIAEVKDNRAFTLAQCQAHAKLIAAAPDLLSSVLELRNQLLTLKNNFPATMPLDNEQRNMLSAALLISDKAIKKATE